MDRDVYRRGLASYGFVVEFDRGSEMLDEYIAKFEAYYRYRDSGEAERDYHGFPKVLCISTDCAAEGQMSEAAFRVWYRRGGGALPMLLTTCQQIREHPEGILGPIWRTPSVATDKKTERRFWLPWRTTGAALCVTIRSGRSSCDTPQGVCATCMRVDFDDAAGRGSAIGTLAAGHPNWLGIGSLNS